MMNKFNIVKFLGIVFVVGLVVILNLDYSFNESVWQKSIRKIYTQKIHEIAGETVMALLPQKASKPVCPDNKTECTLKDGTKVKIIETPNGRMAVSDVLTVKDYKPAGNTWCTKMRQCPENEDWWQGARNACESKGMYLPDLNTLKIIHGMKGKYNLPTSGWYWSSIKGDDYSRVFDFFFETGTKYRGIRMYKNNAICVLYL